MLILHTFNLMTIKKDEQPITITGMKNPRDKIYQE